MNNTYKIKTVTKEKWINLVNSFQDYNYRQAWEFGIACASRIGADCEHIMLEGPNNNVVGIADVRVKKIPKIGGGIAYINGGPLFIKNEVFNEDTFSEILSALINEYVKKRKLTLRINPFCIAEIHREAADKLFKKHKFNNLKFMNETIIIDLNQDLANIRQNFNKKWRYCLKKAEKTDIELCSGNDSKTFQKFIPMFKKFKSDKGFNVDIGIDLYARVQEKSNLKDKYFVTIAYKNKIPIAGHVASILGDTCVYLLGASTDDGRKMNASYLLQWKTLEMAKNNGCTWYDLGGIDDKENPGVYRFKKRMGGDKIQYLGPYELRSAGVKDFIIKYGEKIYKFKKIFGRSWK